MISILLSLLISCQSGKELHYFKQGDNYFRIKIKEYAFLSSSRYQSGYFDELSLDRYFGEIKRPDTTGSFIKYSIDKDGNLKAAPPNSKLIMVLSTTAKALTDQIGAFAENDQALEIIARLANKDAILNNAVLRNHIINLNNDKQSMKEYSKHISERLIDSVSYKNQNLFEILEFVNRLALKNGNKIPFKTIDEAKIWYLNL